MSDIMDNTLRMANFPRHINLVNALVIEIGELFKRKELYPLTENAALVIWNKKYSGDERFVLPQEVEHNIEIIDALDYIQPDFLFFKKNKFVQNKNTLKTAGVPDLVIEIWSISNTREEKEMKFRIYSSSNDPICEHWYIEQDNNRVSRWYGTKQLEDDSLNNILITKDGIEFDLRYLALD